MIAMMHPPELRAALSELNLSQAEAARLLSVNQRTMRRWLEDGEGVSGPVEMALRAWLRLNRVGLAWRPDGLSLGEDHAKEIAEQIAKFREHAIQLDALLRKVKKRGGPAAPWKVDIEKCVARLGSMSVSFYKLANGSFSPSCYSRLDRQPDLELDAPLLEDAYACIAQAIAAERINA